MLRTLLFIHRYLAVAVGLLMALWCLSGFVMLYQQYPTLTDAEHSIVSSSALNASHEPE